MKMRAANNKQLNLSFKVSLSQSSSSTLQWNAIQPTHPVTSEAPANFEKEKWKLTFSAVGYLLLCENYSKTADRTGFTS